MIYIIYDFYDLSIISRHEDLKEANYALAKLYDEGHLYFVTSAFSYLEITKKL
jgi:hypothetical protein